MRILVIEDEPKTGAYLKKGLEESGYRVDVATSDAIRAVSCKSWLRWTTCANTPIV